MEQSRVKNTSKNLISAIIFQIVKMLLVFISRIIFVKKLGASYLGINGLFSNILSVLSLADLGMITVLMYSLYKPLAQHDEKKVSQYLNFFKVIYKYIAFAILVVGVLLIPFLKYLVNLPDNIPNMYFYYILLLCNSIMSYLFIYRTTLLSADQKMYIINKYDTIFQILLFSFQIIILWITGSFALYLITNIVCTLFGNLMKVRATNKIYPYLKNKKVEKLNKEERKTITENIKSMFLYKVGSVIQSNTDNILISIFVGTIVVGYYSNYSIIIASITTFITMFFTSLKASIGNYICDDNKKETDKISLFNNLEIYNFWLIGFCSICFICLIPDFIIMCFGFSYNLGYGALICIVLNFYTSNIRQTIWAYRETTGLFKKTRYVTLITAIVNIFSSIICGYYFGLIGIILATVISRMIYAWWKEPQVLYNDYFKKSSREYYIHYVSRVMICTLICYITFEICNLSVFTNIYISFFYKTLVCIIIPNLLLYIIYRKNSAIILIKKIVHGGLRK